MKRTLKIGLVAGSILLFVGLIISWVALCMTNFDVRAIFGGNHIKTPQTTQADSKDVEKLNVETHFQNVTLKESTGDSIEMTYSSTLFESFLENGVLTVRELKTNRVGWEWYRAFKVDFDGELEIALPKDFSGSIEVQAAMGNVKLLNVQGKDANVTASMGNVTFRNCTLSNGEVFLDQGQLRVQDSFFDNFSGQCQLGSGTLDRLEAETVVYQGDMGNLRFEELKSEDISVAMGMGEVRGSILGHQEDYRIFVETGFGDTNLVNGGNGTSSLYVKTNMGASNIDFVR